MPERTPRTRMDDLTVERVLRVVEAIPPGRVAAYGEVGAIVGVGPRLVGRIMGAWGSSTPWWRVTNAAGRLPEHLQAEALAAYREEGTPIRDDHADLRRARWRPGFDE